MWKVELAQHNTPDLEKILADGFKPWKMFIMEQISQDTLSAGAKKMYLPVIVCRKEVDDENV